MLLTVWRSIFRRCRNVCGSLCVASVVFSPLWCFACSPLPRFGGGVSAKREGRGVSPSLSGWGSLGGSPPTGGLRPPHAVLASRLVLARLRCGCRLRPLSVLAHSTARARLFPCVRCPLPSNDLRWSPACLRCCWAALRVASAPLRRVLRPLAACRIPSRAIALDGLGSALSVFVVWPVAFCRRFARGFIVGRRP